MTELPREPAHPRSKKPTGGRPLKVWSEVPGAAPVLRALRQGREVEELTERPDPAAIDAAAETAETLLLCLSPAGALALAMARQIPPSQALEEWRRQARRLLELTRDRRGVTILYLDVITRHPGEVAELLGLADPGRILAAAPEEDGEGEPATHPEEDDGEEDPASAWQDPVLRLLARNVIAADEKAQALAAELDAVSALAPEGETAAAEDAEAAFRAWTLADDARRQADARAKRESALNDRNAALQAALEQILEQAGAEAEWSRDEIKARTDRAEALSAELETARNEAATREARIEELQAELEPLRSGTGATREELELLQAQADLMRSELDAMAREKVQLEQHLALARQDLDRFRAQAEAGETELNTLRDRAAEKDRSLQAAGGEMRVLEGRAADLAALLRQTQDRLRHVEGSRSMRLTRPLRRIRFLLRGRGGA